MNRIAAKITPIQNIHCHDMADKIAPPTVGPIAGPTPITIEMVPIIAPRRSAGTRRMTVVMTRGIITAVPDACTTRPVSRAPKFGAIAHSVEPSAKEVMATRNIARGEKRSSRKPVMGMTTAIVTKNPLMSHWTVAILTSRVLDNSDNAIETVVSFKIITKAAMTITPMMRLVLAGLRGCCGLGVNLTEEPYLFDERRKCIAWSLFPRGYQSGQETSNER